MGLLDNACLLVGYCGRLVSWISMWVCCVIRVFDFFVFAGGLFGVLCVDIVWVNCYGYAYAGFGDLLFGLLL